MPIDATLLRPQEEGGALHQVIQWQLQRQPTNNNKSNNDDDEKEIKTVIEEIQTKRHARRTTLSTMNTLRFTYNQLCKSKSSTKEEKDKVKDELKRVKVLFDELNNEVEYELLPRLSNMVDDTPWKEEETNQNKAASKEKEQVLDPMYCINAHDTTNEQKAWTTIGSQLEHALLSYALHYFSSHFYQYIHLPNGNMDTSLLRSTLGFTEEEIPFYLQSCTLHHSKTYSESTLPQSYISTSPAKQELYVHPTTSVQFTTLTTNHLSTSRNTQNDMMRAMYTFYSSLLLQSSTTLRVKMVESHNLESNESRRLLLQGFLPSTSSKKSKKKEEWIQLGYVANTTDYVTRAFQMKCGRRHKTKENAGETQEYVHLIHGAFSSTDVILEWLVSHNVVFLPSLDVSPKIAVPSKPKKQEERSGGVGLPISLASHLPSQPWKEETKDKCVFIPFVQRLIRNKNGKVIVQKSSSSLDDMLLVDMDVLNGQHRQEEKEILSSKHENDQRNVNSTTSSTAALPSLPIMKSGIPTTLWQNDIVAEAKCSSFDFLPFYYK